MAKRLKKPQITNKKKLVVPATKKTKNTAKKAPPESKSVKTERPPALKVSPTKSSTSTSVDVLLELLLRFSRSERAPLLGEMQVAQVIPESKGSVNTLSFLDLSKLEKDQLSSLFRKKPSSIPAIETYLRGVLPASSDEKPLVPAVDTTLTPENAGDLGLHTLSQVFGSSEAELLFIETVQKLLASKSFEDHKHQRLANYWDTRWPRAPFEEAMTFAQLSKVNTEAFLKKRSMTPQKVAAVIGAVERFLKEDADKSMAAVPPTTITTPVNPSQKVEIETNKPVWPKSELYLPSHAIGFLKFYELQAGTLDANTSFGKLVARLPQALSTAEFIFLWMHCDYEPSMVSNLLKLDAETGQKIFNDGCAKLRSELESQHPARYQLMKLTLASTASQRDSVLKALLDTRADADFARVINLLSLRAIGAVRPRAFDYVFKDHLTLEESGIELLLELVLQRLPLPEKDLARQLSLVLPLVRFEELAPALTRRAHYDKHRNAWIRNTAAKDT